MSALLIAAALAAAEPTVPPPLPDGVRRMVESAAKSGNQARIDAVAAVARETHPEQVAEINAIVAAAAAERQAAREKRIREAGVLENWQGSGELGGSVATGNSDAMTFAAGLALTRNGLDWRHALAASADLQSSGGRTTQERLSTSWQSDWKLSQRAYLFGRLGWERNRQAGLVSRFEQALGGGYRILDESRLRWEVEGGPAFRQAEFTDRTENTLSIRAASRFRWDISEATRLTQVTSANLEETGSLSANTALTSRLFGRLSARLGFNLQVEFDPPAGRDKLDTVTRATLVYDFRGL
ncbi:MAG: YdiY family protein [Thermaurantiacus sp.]